ncbi:MAG: prepilin peptidase [Lachnospiraceae bacterium]|nr:prepilin peptidase [Lachnospiraceae bacterium]
MKEYIILAGLVLGVPLIYWGLLQWYKPDFEEEKNQNRKIFHSWQEILVMLVSEVAAVKLWHEWNSDAMSSVMLTILYTVLAVMSVLCMVDYWEKIVPNRILLVWLSVGGIEIGLWCVRDLNSVLKLIPSIVLGVIFCALVFGLAYLIGRGGLGSGDVKLSFLLGLFMTGEYVVGAVFYGCLLSALYSLIQLWRKKMTRKDEMPFVPYLYIGIIIIYLVG